MFNKSLSKIWILVIIAVITAGAFFVWSRRLIPEDRLFPSSNLNIESKQQVDISDDLVTITTDKTEYEYDQNIKVVVKNNLDRSIWFIKDNCSPYLKLFGYDEQNWSRALLLPPSPPPGSCIASMQEIEQGGTLTLEYNPSHEHSSKYLNFVKYKFDFAYRDTKESGEYTTVYSNDFIIKERLDTQAKCRQLSGSLAKELKEVNYCETVGDCVISPENLREAVCCNYIVNKNANLNSIKQIYKEYLGSQCFTIECVPCRPTKGMECVSNKCEFKIQPFDGTY